MLWLSRTYGIIMGEGWRSRTLGFHYEVWYKHAAGSQHILIDRYTNRLTSILTKMSNVLEFSGGCCVVRDSCARFLLFLT